MASWDSMLNGALNGLTGVVKAAIIFFVFAGILFDTPVDALGGIMGFVDTFLNGGLTGLLVSCLLSLYKDQYLLINRAPCLLGSS